MIPGDELTEVRPFRPDKSLANEVAGPKGRESMASLIFICLFDMLSGWYLRSLVLTGGCYIFLLYIYDYIYVQNLEHSVKPAERERERFQIDRVV